MSSSLIQPTDPLLNEDRPSAPELFSQDQLERHAVTLAGLYRLAPDPVRGRPLLPRLDASAHELDDSYRFLSAAVTKDAPAVGSEDWLRDNHHVVQDQVREIRQDLPRHYYLELPKLADGPLAGYPRVYAFARELITHTAGRLDLQTLVDFATAYQRVAPLTIGEIWAIPIMLRLALVEELRRLAADVVAARRSRDRARKWGVQLNTSTREPDRVIAEMLRDEAAASGRLSAPFVVELLHWLRDQPSSAAPAWHALQRALEAQDDSAEEMLRLEHQREAAGQLAIANIITRCGCCRRSSGRSSSSASAWSSRSSAKIPRARTRGWISRPATGTATPSSSSPVAPRRRSRTSRGARWNWLPTRSEPLRSRTAPITSATS